MTNDHENEKGRECRAQLRPDHADGGRGRPADGQRRGRAGPASYFNRGEMYSFRDVGALALPPSNADGGAEEGAEGDAAAAGS